MNTPQHATLHDPDALGRYPVFAITFGSVFSVLYLFVMNYSWQLFTYYPQSGRFAFLKDALPAASSPGPAMKWYGYVATCAIVSFVAGVIVSLVPPGLLKRFWWPGLIWLVPGVAILVVLYLIVAVGD